MILWREVPDGSVRTWLRRAWVLLAALILLLAVARVVHELVGVSSVGGWDAAVLATLTIGIAIGSAMPVRLGRANAVTPLATASAVAMVFASCRPADLPVTYSASDAIVGVGIGYIAGVAFGRRSGHAPRRPVAVAVPLITFAVMAALYRSIPFWHGWTGVQLYREWDSQRWKSVCVMTIVAGVPLLAEVMLVGFLVNPLRTVRDFVVDVLRVLGPVYAAAASTGIAIAIGLQLLSLWAVPLIAMPLLLARAALSRTFDVQRERRQSVAALATMTDVAGFTRAGHSGRVAALSQRVGRRLNLSDRELAVLEEAALLHDIGQVSLTTPIPGGATVEAAPLDQLSIAAEGGAILRRSGILEGVAEIVESQTVQYRQVREFGENVPIAARIIKVCNAFDDLTGGEEAKVDAAFERLSLGLGYEYDPAIVTALQRIHGRLDRVARMSR